MKNNILILTLIILGLTLFSQCKGKQGKCLGTIKFSEEDRKIIPYTGGELVIFIDSLGDSVSYSVTAPFYDIAPVYAEHVNQFDVEKYDYYNVEHCQEFAFQIYLNISSPFTPPIQKYFRFDGFHLLSHPEITGGFYGSCLFDMGQLFTLPDGKMLVSYYDSLNIFNNKFYSLYDLSSTIAQPPDSIETYRNIYYSLSQGIIGIKTSKGRRWCLK